MSAANGEPSSAGRRRLVARWLGDYRVEVSARDGRFKFLSDEAFADGGDDSGPMPSELLFGSVAACFAMAVVWVARKRRQTLPDLEVTVRASYDRSARRYTEIEIEAMSTLAETDPRGFETLARLAEQVCWITRTLEPGVPVLYRAAAPVRP